MKKIKILILSCCLIVPLEVLANVSGVIISGGAGPPDVSDDICGDNDLMCVDFEEPTYVQGELTGQDGWIQSTSYTNQVLVAIDQNNTPNGSQTSYVNGTTGGSGFYFKTFAQQTGLVTYDFYLRAPNAPGDSARFILYSSAVPANAARALDINIAANDVYNVASSRDITNTNMIASDTWYHFQFECTPATNSCDIYINNSQVADNEGFRYSQTNLGAFAFAPAWGSGDDIYVDDLRVYAGGREP